LIVSSIAVEKQLIGPLNLERRLYSISGLEREIIRGSGKNIEIDFDKPHPTIIWGQALNCPLAKTFLMAGRRAPASVKVWSDVTSNWRATFPLPRRSDFCGSQISRRFSL
jgi:hypothetical protein